MVGTWEFANEAEMLDLLVGATYGANPWDKVAEIKRQKREVAEEICQNLNLLPHFVGLEIGAGCGFISLAMSENVKYLHCGDVSSSFLDVARKNCSERRNLAFYHIEHNNLAFLEAESLDFAYAHNVFIHLDLYDIHLYLQELRRVLKAGAPFYFDFMNISEDSEISWNRFREGAEYFKQDRRTLTSLLKFNDPSHVQLLAKKCGFQNIRIKGDETGRTELFGVRA